MLTEDEQQRHLLLVSRTFALTIPLIKGQLADAIANAYLICRIADTMEDDPKLAPEQKVRWLRRFAYELEHGFADDEKLLQLQDAAAAQLKDSAVPAEYALCCELLKVLQRTRSYPVAVQRIIGHGAAVLSAGMAEHLSGLSVQSLDDVDAYCYSVAGVVGELLAKLFALYDPQCPQAKIFTLAVSFGEGLQLTNILKDRDTDAARDVSFLPAVQTGSTQEQLIAHYCALAQGHLQQATDFTCMLSGRKLYGVRLFCLLNIAMAVLTLKRIERHPLGTQQELKISRRTVKMTLLLCTLCARFNFSARLLLRLLRGNSPCTLRDAAELSHKVSKWEQPLNLLPQL